MMPGYQASDPENAYDFFLGFFFSIRPTDPISGNTFDGKRKKKKKEKRGMDQPKKKKKKKIRNLVCDLN